MYAAPEHTPIFPIATPRST